MPKMKTNRAAAKRLKTTAGGKLKRFKAFARHMLSCKTTKVKRGLRTATTVQPANIASMKKLLPYFGIK